MSRGPTSLSNMIRDVLNPLRSCERLPSAQLPRMTGRWTAVAPMSVEDQESPKNDLALIRAARRGDAEAVTAVADRLTCIPRILIVLNGRGGTALAVHDLEDLSQEVTLLVLRKLGEFRPIGRLEAWVYRICALQLMNARRGAASRRVRHAPLSGGAPLVDERGCDGDPLRSEVLEAAIGELDPDCEAIIRLKHFESLSFTQIGRRLDLSPNTAKARYYRGLEDLRRKLRGSLTEEEVQ